MTDEEYIYSELLKAKPSAGETVRVKARSEAGESRWVSVSAHAYDLLLAALTPSMRWKRGDILFEDAGDIGGDVQIGKSYSIRFYHAHLPGRLVTVAAYPIRTKNYTGEYGDADEVITLEQQTEVMICGDVQDPGSTERWSEVEYTALPERFDGVYATVKEAERAARQLITQTRPEHIDWDGLPEWAIERD